MVEGRCMKCKTNREMNSPKEITMKSGMMAMQGTCPKCSTKMFRIMGKKK